MATQKRSFGLAALGKRLGSVPVQPVASASSVAAERYSNVPKDPKAVILRTDLIVVKPQARVTFAGIESLAESIRVQGLMQPVVVWFNQAGEFELVAGERRLRAVRDVLERREIDARVAANLEEAEAIAFAQLAENLERESYLPMELATELARLKAKHEISNAELGKRIGGVSESFVSKHLSLLTAPEDVRVAIESGRLAATAYFNNKGLFKNGVPEHFFADVAKAGEGASRLGGRAESHAKDTASKKKKSEPMISIPYSTAVALFEVLQSTAKRLKLDPIKPRGDLDRLQLKVLLAKHAVPVRRKLAL